MAMLTVALHTMTIVHTLAIHTMARSTMAWLLRLLYCGYAYCLALVEVFAVVVTSVLSR